MSRPSKFKYYKICKLRRCKKRFGTNLEWQKFCEPAHHDEYWNDLRKDERAALRRLTELEKKIEKLEAQRQE